MTITKKITFVASSISDATLDQHMSLFDTLNLKFERIDKINDLFTALSSSSFSTDYINLDLDNACLLSKTSIFELINTISTLIKCNVDRDIKILIGVGDTTSPELIKEIINFPAVIALSMRIGGNFTRDDVHDCFANILVNNFNIPKKIQEIIHPRKKNTVNSNKIALTPRQQQIFKMVTDRGSSNKIIAKMLNISESTVKLHMSSILKKYKVKNRTQLAVFSKTLLENKVQSDHK